MSQENFAHFLTTNKRNQIITMTTTPIALVTGANGYVASFIVKELLEHGYKVRGTVRSLSQKSKYSHLLQLPNAEQNLELVEADLLKDGSFDEAVRGCLYVLHTASPFFTQTHNPETDLVEPALHGTRNVLSSVEKYHTDVKRVLITSSTAAVTNFPDRIIGRVYTEEDWNETSSLTNGPYAYSKTLAEKEAWKILNELKEKYPQDKMFDLSVLNPTLVVGPILQVDRVKEFKSELNTSCKIVLDDIMTYKMDPQKPKIVKADNGRTMVDARDVARAHRLVLETPEAGGKRFILSAGKGQWAKLNRALVEKFPELAPYLATEVEGDEQEAYDAIINLSTEQIQKTIPNFEFIPVEQSIIDCVQSLIDNGLTEV
jgi:dihydroflavonol-4-reductase